MQTSQLWPLAVDLPRFPALSEDLVVDVVVIGAGLTGISAAYLLKRAGLRVALVERGRCGGMDTPNTTAHLSWVTDKRLHQLVKQMGPDHALGAWEAGMAALDQIATNVQSIQKDCDFRWLPGYLIESLDGDDEDPDALRWDAELAEGFGLRAEFLHRVPYFSLPGTRFWPQAAFHPLKYLSGLLETIPGQGSHVFEDTNVHEFQEKPLSVEAGGYTIQCAYLVIATHVPLVGNTPLAAATLLQSKLFPYTSYALGAQLPSGLIPEALFWDTAEPYHYLRIDRKAGHDYAIFGGADHKTGQENDTVGAFRRLERTLFRWIKEAQIDHRWSGQVIETNDGLPFIGETAENQFVATGFAGNGMTFGTLGAMMAVDGCLRTKNPWVDLFSPTRSTLTSNPWHYLNENKDYPYYLVRDWLARGQQKSLSDLTPGTGAIVQLQGRKVAAYRSPSGELSLCSPICTHLKCIVKWNEAEQSWDCPCHGSRFKPTGEVISGPAEKDLPKLSPE